MEATEAYNCCFVEPPPNDLVCKICFCVSRNVQQTNNCCGHNFCRDCLERYLQSTVTDRNICPYCRQPNFTFVPDIKAERQILNLKTYCPNKQLGCTWTGELRSMEKHLNKNVNIYSNGCPYTKVECINCCGVVMQRGLLEDHQKSDCKFRQVTCDYCGIMGTYQWVTSYHQQEECHKYLLECPNHCKVSPIRREDMTRHLEGCPLAIVNCPFSTVGCDTVVRRNCLTEHLKMMAEQHIKCNKDTIASIQHEVKEAREMLEVKSQQLDNTQARLKEALEKLSATENELHLVKQELKDVKKELHSRSEENETKLQRLQTQFEDVMRLLTSSSSPGKSPVDHDDVKTDGLLMVKVTDFEHKRYHREGWYSQSFYTSEQGYKMCLYFNLGGIGKGRDTHISIGAFLMKGEHDEHLSWPVKGLLHVQLLNQITDYHHVAIKLKFGSGNYSERVTDGTRSFSGCYCDRAIAHSHLEYSTNDNTQYLKDDCIHCNVVEFTSL